MPLIELFMLNLISKAAAYVQRALRPRAEPSAPSVSDVQLKIGELEHPAPNSYI